MNINEEKCSICLENIENNEYNLPECNHNFHTNCIITWFRAGHNCCPLCRNNGINGGNNSSNTSLNHINSELTQYSWIYRRKLLNDDYVKMRRLSRKKDALLALNKALKLEPNNPYRYSSRAFIKDAMGDTKGAISDYMKCIELDPEDAIAFNNLGILEEKIGRQSSATKHLNKADELIQMLDENKISLQDDSENNFKPKNVQQEINQEKMTLKEKGRVGIILQVFKNSTTRKEFFKFIKDGIKK